MQPLTVKNLIGKKICHWQTETPLGRVIDVIVQPMTGQILGLIWETETNAKLKLSIENMKFAQDKIKISKLNLNKSLWRQHCYLDGIQARQEVIGQNVIDKKGKVVGKIDEILIDQNFSTFKYQVKTIKSFKDYKHEFYLPGAALVRLIKNKNQLLILSQYENLIQRANQSNFKQNSWFSNSVSNRKFEYYPFVIWLSMICLALGVISYT